jgi:large subunit ribosomal protein L1
MKGDGQSAESVVSSIMEVNQKEFNSNEIIEKVIEVSKERKFNESFELILKLNVDPTQGDQNIRGTCILPSGTGQQIRVAVFADLEFHEKLTEAGADIIGSPELIKSIQAGEINFDKIIATPEHMPQLKALARILGPKGLMPNVKSGNLVKPDDLIETVNQSKQGMIEYRVNDDGAIMNKFGKRSFTPDELRINLEAILKSIAVRKPESVKGRFMAKGMVKTTMGPVVKLDLEAYKE